MSINTSVSEKLFWEDLIEARQDAVDAVLHHQLLALKLAEVNDGVLKQEPELNEVLVGLVSTYNDLANDIMTNQALHSYLPGEVKVGFKSGEITDADEQLGYIETAAVYLTISEKVNHIGSSSYINIFTKLNICTAKLSKLVSNNESTITELKGNL